MKAGLFLFLLSALLYGSVKAGEIRPEFLLASSTPLNNPHDLKLSPDGRQLYVSDVGNNRVVVLDPDSLEFIWSFGADHQSGTHDVDFDAAGRAYVADTHNNRVIMYSIEADSARQLAVLDERIRGPEGVLAHSNGRIYVAGAWSGNVVAYQQGRPVAELGGLSSPHDLEEAANGDIWLSDSGNHRLLLVSADLTIKRELTRQQYRFNGVRYLDLLDDGTLVAADKDNHQIKFISSDGALLHVLGSGKRGRGPGEFVTPEGVEVRGNTLWLSDSGNNRIVKYRLD